MRGPNRKRVLLCGPSRDAVAGVSTHINQLFGSSIAEKYTLLQFQVGSAGRSERILGKLLRFVTSPLALASEIIRLRPDILHLNTSLVPKAYWRDLTYLVVAKVLRCKAVYQVHGGESPFRFLGTNAFGQGFLRWSLRIPDAIVLLAEVERDSFQSFAVPTRTYVIPNAIDLEEYRRAKPKCFDGPALVLGYIGRLVFDKGIAEAIRAVAILRRTGLDGLHFQIAGSGADERELRELVTREGLNDAVTFAGPLFGEAKLRFWEDIDLFVFPTASEGLPYTLLEAMASGTPVLTTRVGGIPDVIQAGVQGEFGKRARFGNRRSGASKTTRRPGPPTLHVPRRAPARPRVLRTRSARGPI